MVSFCRLVSRRAFLHGVLASVGLCSCRNLPNPGGAKFVRLREPLSVSASVLSNNGGSMPFEAWLTPDDGPDKLLEGILIQADGRLVAYSTYCPHEVCPVKLVRDPASLNDTVTAGVAIPDHEVMYCGCHYSIFNPRSGGRRLSGPAPRGLYRFRVERDGDTVHVTHVEAAILDLYG